MRHFDWRDKRITLCVNMRTITSFLWHHQKARQKSVKKPLVHLPQPLFNKNPFVFVVVVVIVFVYVFVFFYDFE